MKRQRLQRLLVAAFLSLALAGGLALAQTAPRPEQWVATWGAAMHQPAANAQGYNNQTIRMFMRTSIAGREPAGDGAFDLRGSNAVLLLRL